MSNEKVFVIPRNDGEAVEIGKVLEQVPEAVVEAKVNDRTLQIEAEVYLAPSYQEAQKFVQEHGQPDATVEAEYGEQVIEGKTVTLAHHGSRSDNPAPCNDPRAVPLQDDHKNTILISHIDLDTLGGILALEGKKPDDPDLWKAAAYIDVNGPHHIHELAQPIQDKLNAYYAYVADTREKNNIGRPTETIDVTQQIKDYEKAIEKIADEKNPEHDAMINRGIEWERNTTKAVEDRLVAENENVRVFSTNGPFCGSAYYSPNREQIVPAVLSYNEKFHSITLSFADGGEKYSAKEIVQQLWGPGAGGRDGIAGSPRGQEMTQEDLAKAFEKVMSLDKPEHAHENPAQDAQNYDDER